MFLSEKAHRSDSVLVQELGLVPLFLTRLAGGRARFYQTIRTATVFRHA